MTQSISMINLRKLLTCKVLCYSKMWSSRFHVSWRTASPERAAVQRKKHELKALGPDRLLSTTENLSHLEGAESFRYPWNLESMYEELKIDDSFCSGKRACYSRRAATPGYLRTWNSHRSWEANSCIRISFGSSACVVDCTFFHVKKTRRRTWRSQVTIVFTESISTHLCYMCLLIDLSTSAVYWYIFFCSCVMCPCVCVLYWQLFLLDVLNIRE